ncbi:Ail/Lom family outer membrane beta-barrel protein [Leuconostocaceae bacterium ESL0958]|nr:Ail/Lom family outer membrane beta-barrel protein [Leuconostocaceae bacterium ESL0958]
MIAVYNQRAVGDVLMLTFAPGTGTVESKGNVTRVVDPTDQKTLAMNLFDLGQVLGLTEQPAGQVILSDDQLAKVNDAIATAGFPERIEDAQSKLVVGYVQSMTDHPDSDHLHVVQVQVGPNEADTLQIVSGSPNMATDSRVVVAQPGSLMPSGASIWSGALRGVPSAGMIVSGRELQLPGAPDKPGALILPADFGVIGEPFDLTAAANLYRDGLIDTNY